MLQQVSDRTNIMAGRLHNGLMVECPSLPDWQGVSPPVCVAVLTIVRARCTHPLPIATSSNANGSRPIDRSRARNGFLREIAHLILKILMILDCVADKVGKRHVVEC